MPARLIRPLVLLTLLAAPAVSAAADRFGEVRRRMVSEYIVREGIKNPQVLEAMRTVPRHEFVPLRLRRFAYQDAALAIGHRQTISPPFIVAYMTETIDPRPTHRVLEIGTGSGYQAAVSGSGTASRAGPRRLRSTGSSSPVRPRTSRSRWSSSSATAAGC